MGYATPIERSFLGYRASNNLLAQDTTEYCTNSMTYELKAKMYYIQSISYLSNLRFSADVKIDAGVGTIWITSLESGKTLLLTNFTNAVYAEVYDDFSMNEILKGEEIGVYIKVNNPVRTACFKNLSIRGTQAPVYIE